MPPTTPPAIAAVFVFGARSAVASAGWLATVAVVTVLGTEVEAAKLCTAEAPRPAPIGTITKVVGVGDEDKDDNAFELERAAVDEDPAATFELNERLGEW